MQDLFLTNYTDKTLLDKIKESFNKCNTFSLSVSFIKKSRAYINRTRNRRSLRSRCNW